MHLFKSLHLKPDVLILFEVTWFSPSIHILKTIRYYVDKSFLVLNNYLNDYYKIGNFFQITLKIIKFFMNIDFKYKKGLGCEWSKYV